MTYRMLILAALATALALPATAESLQFKPTSVQLPDDRRAYPDGPGAEAMNNNCLACHSAGMVLNQPTLARATWQAEVTKMIAVYKAPIDQADLPAIIDYLARVKGPAAP